MINKTEQQIMQNWHGDEMIVSITCVAFNHENYMNTTLDSFLMQETSFPFEVLINDDVSTDKTVEILKEYERKFPNIVKPVYQTENQYSQGINTMAILFPYIKGKYVAFCDGDDYWIDKDKLKIQVEEIEKHSDVDMCFHSTYKLVGNVREEVTSRHAENTKVFTPQEVILGGGVFCPTASLLFTNRLISSLPSWFNTAIPGDFVSQIMGAARGGALYLDRIMSVYRSGIEGSWTKGELRKSTEQRRESVNNIADQLKFLDNFFDNKYHKEFNAVIHNDRFDFISMVTNDINVKKEVYSQYKNDFSIFEKLQWHLLFKHQKLIKTLKSIKLKINASSFNSASGL